MKELIKRNWMLLGLASLTLGLSPFTPESHLFGKTIWIIGGAEGMQAIDWFDFLLHASPWILFFISIGINLIDRTKRAN